MAAQLKPLRVLQVSARYFPYIGGVETHVYEVAPRLKRLGVEVTVLTTNPGGYLSPSDEIEGIPVRRVRAWPAHEDYYFAPNIFRVIAEGGWDIIHCQGVHTFVPPLTMVAAARAGIPYVVSFHTGGDTSRFRHAFRGVQWQSLRPLLARATRLIGPSEWEIEFFRKQLRLPRSQFEVIPNGAHHLPEVTPGARERSNNAIILSLGRLERYKGHQRVISALPKIQEQIPNVQLDIVGTGSYKSELQELAKKLGVADRVAIQSVPPGDRTGMSAMIAKADLVTLLSEHEAQGIAVLEALALKRPVLVAYTTALREFADRGLARAVPINSPGEDIAAAVIEQLRHPLVPAHVELPTWDDCAAQLLRVYREVTAYEQEQKRYLMRTSREGQRHGYK